MPVGLTPGLIATALTIGVACYLVVRKSLGEWPAILIALFRVTLPFIYFAWYYNGQWTILDDILYFHGSRLFLQRGYTPISILLDQNARELLRASLNGVITYGWYNIIAQYIFGTHYYAPVFLNVLLTFVSGRILYTYARKSFSEQYARGLLAFFLCQWDIVAWSSVLDVKDICVLTLTLFYMICLINLAEKFRPSLVIALVLSLPVFAGLRFYTPVLLLGTFALWQAVGSRGLRRIVYFGLGLATGAGIIIGWGWNTAYSTFTSYVPELVNGRYSDYLWGTIHFLLNPRPWAIQPIYSFLLLPSILYWASLPICIIGFISLWKHSPVARFALIYTVITILFYGAITAENGMRFRFQLTFAFAWIQYHGVWAILQSIRKSSGMHLDLHSSLKASGLPRIDSAPLC